MTITGVTRKTQSRIFLVKLQSRFPAILGKPVPAQVVTAFAASSPQGVDIGYGDMWLTPKDMAKIGQLYLDKGLWNNTQILPASWVEESTRGHIDATLFDRYGYQWWVDSAGFYAAVGYKGQFIYVVPGKNMVVVFTSDLQKYDFYIPKRMLENYIIPAAVSTEALPPDKVAQARLAELAGSVAMVKEFTWTAQQGGVAKDGVFVRTTSPRFSFAYPLGSKKATIDSPDKVMRMKTPGDVHFSASVVDIPQGLKLKNFGPAGYVPRLKKVGSNVKVVSNQEVILKCGTKAYRTDIKWTWRNTLPISTTVVSAYKNGKCVFVCAHPWKNHFRVEPIVTSLTFE